VHYTGLDPNNKRKFLIVITLAAISFDLVYTLKRSKAERDEDG